MAALLKIKDIDLFKHKTDKYIKVLLYMISKKNDN